MWEESFLLSKKTLVLYCGITYTIYILLNSFDLLVILNADYSTRQSQEK